MVRVYKRLADWRIVFVLLLLLLPWSYLFQTSSHSFRAEDGPGHVDMQFEFRKSVWKQNVEKWGAQTGGKIDIAVQNYRTHLLKLDFVFPVYYVILAMSTIAALTNEPGRNPSRGVLILFLLPILGGVFDLAENLMHINILQGVSTVEDLDMIPANAIRLSFTFTVLKVSLVAVPLLAAIALGVYRRFFKTKSQTESLASMITGNPHEPAIKAILERTRDLSEEQKEEAERELVDRLEGLRKDLEEETDAQQQSELEDTIREIEAEYEEFRILRWWDTHVSSDLDRVIGREGARIKARRERAAEEFRVAIIENQLKEDLERLGAELEQEKDGQKRNELENKMEEARIRAAEYLQEGGGLSPPQIEYRDQLAGKEKDKEG